MRPDIPTIHDPYADCESGCSHDLAFGVLVNDLHVEGPYPQFSPLAGPGWLAAQVALAAERQASRIRG